MEKIVKIKLQNKTHWRDDHIRAFVARVAHDERTDLCKRGGPALTVVVAYTRGGDKGSLGCAFFLSNWITVRLAKQGTPDKVDFAHVIAHELAHTRGMRHSAMRGNSHYCRQGSYRTIYGWGEQLPFEVKASKVAQRPTVMTKLKRDRKNLQAALTREKRAATLRKKWVRKVKYYERRASA
jgi:hypothetical protein